MSLLRLEFDGIRGGFALWFGAGAGGNNNPKESLNGLLKIFINSDCKIIGVDQMFYDRGGLRLAGLEYPQECMFEKRAPRDTEYEHFHRFKHLREIYARQGQPLSEVPTDARDPGPNLYDYIDSQYGPEGTFPLNQHGAHYGTQMVRVIQNIATLTPWFGGIRCDEIPPTRRDEQFGISLWLYRTRVYGIRVSFRCLAVQYRSPQFNSSHQTSSSVDCSFG
jgi:hypothetical protein